MSLFQMTLSGGAFILFIVVIRALALHRLPKAAFLALWEMAALRLLLPFTIPLPFAIPLPFSVLVPMGQLPAAGEHLVAGEVPVLELPDMGIPGTPAPAGTASSAVLPMIWLVGMALMTAYFVVFYVRTRRRFRISIPDDTPAVRRWLAGKRLHRPLEVRQSAQISSPLTYGILRPVILLPADMERDDEAALTYILTHEFVHIRRFDGVTKLVFAAALCVHWFNPLAWVLYVLANRDLELSCDERVMGTLGGEEKASYALTLINMAEAQSRHFSPYNHFSKLAIEERIEAIMKYKKASILAVALAVVLVICATTAFAATNDPAPSTTIGMTLGDCPTMVDILAAGEKTNLTVRWDQLTDVELAGNLEDAENLEVTLIAVGPADESKFSPEEWAEILKLVEQGKVRWVEDTADVVVVSANAPFGLVDVTDCESADDNVPYYIANEASIKTIEAGDSATKYLSGEGTAYTDIAPGAEIPVGIVTLGSGQSITVSLRCEDSSDVSVIEVGLKKSGADSSEKLVIKEAGSDPDDLTTSCSVEESGEYVLYVKNTGTFSAGFSISYLVR